ncbi:MAG: hypothetical protein ACT6FE_06450 [Methanosarcinaceae archaeon]
MKIRKSCHQQMNLLSYSTNDVRWDMLPGQVCHVTETLLAQLILSVHADNNSPNREEQHAATENK